MYDLSNESSIKYLSEALNKKSAEFAMKQNPTSLNQFVEVYQFFKSWALNIRAGINKNELTSKQEHAQQTLVKINNMGTLAVNLLIDSVAVAKKIGVGPVHGVSVGNIRAFAAHLRFKSETALAYHVIKHFHELPSPIKNQEFDISKIDIAEELKARYREASIYLNTARMAIKNGTLMTRPGQFKVNENLLTFSLNINGALIETYVQIFNDQAVISTCLMRKIINDL